MKLLLLCCLCVVNVVWGIDHRHHTTTTSVPPPPMETRVKELEDILEGLTRQVMLQQFYMEEKSRSDGNSGIKQVRAGRDGTKNYYQPAHVDRRFMAMHDHANYDRTVGMGEIMLVMNGVEFRTRHNDYKLRMPSPTSSEYHATEYIPFPPVPKSVLDKPTVEEQIAEMREYFRAFKDQNVTHRDYRPHFRPNLCYVEGGWGTGTKHLDEPFQSDRHAIDAASWFDLMDKVRYTSYTGSKSVDENFAFLPTTISSVENGIPHYAQWNYRIVCHPLKDDLPLNVFKPEDDLLYRFPNRVGMDKVATSRAQRFYINERDVDHYGSGRSLLDDLMMQIPGKNNYPANLHDNSFDMVMEDVRSANHSLLNTGYYHRYFKTLDKGAMGLKSIHRGYSDANLWVAQTTQQQVAAMNVTNCHKEKGVRNKICNTWSSRYTYALPLEIVFTTPIQTWNPYDLAVNDLMTVTGNHRRNGGSDVRLAYNGTNPKQLHYLTPSAFYSSGNVENDPADTAKKGAGVLDKNGQVKMVASAGIRIATPNIEGVGQIRLRYPILPVHGEGSGVWKEVNALKDMTMHMNRYASLFEERPGTHINGNGTTDESAVLHFKLSTTILDPPGEHGHDFFINVEELEEIKKGRKLTMTTSEDLGHSHELVLTWKRTHLWIDKCDGLTHCWDAHSNIITQF